MTHAGRPIAVLLQRFVEAEPSAVAVSAHPVAGHRDEVVLEALQGHPVDLECAYDRGTLQLLECRPLTALAPE